MTQGKKPFAVGFIGRSGSGKTTLSEKVLAELVRRGRRVAAIKDAHHGVDLDRPGKDTWRYREAGASRVILRTAERWAVMSETPEGPVSIEELISLAGEADIILIEGFKHEGSFPRIEVRRREAAKEPPLAERGGLKNPPVAVATDFEEPGFEGIPRLSLNAPQAVADFIEDLMSGETAREIRHGSF